MENAFPELLAREDILRILEERKISGIANLPDHELLRVFKTFAVPLAKREGRERRSSPLKRMAANSDMDIDEPEEPKKYCHFNAIKGEILCYREKRHINFEDCLDDDSLTSATKRIKITWP